MVNAAPASAPGGGCPWIGQPATLERAPAVRHPANDPRGRCAARTSTVGSPEQRHNCRMVGNAVAPARLPALQSGRRIGVPQHFLEVRPRPAA